MMLRIPSPQSSPASGRGSNRENQFYNPDHAPRLRAQQQQEQETAEMTELEERAMPLQWAVYAAIVVFGLSLAADGLMGHIEHVADLAATNEAMVQCIKGKAIGLTLSPTLSRDAGEGANENGNIELSDAVLRCDVREYQLVAGIGDEVQP